MPFGDIKRSFIALWPLLTKSLWVGTLMSNGNITSERSCLTSGRANDSVATTQQCASFKMTVVRVTVETGNCTPSDAQVGGLKCKE